ncbi:MAG TPA: DUF302 domain-containing protein [Candidatus Acidoferrum sp.]|nr:DUF302 domain-containing protein [Candidatus Acidoferrum sp.]
MSNDHGLVRIASPYSVDETLKRLLLAFHDKGLQPFGLIDHSGEAEKAGLHMQNTKVLIFGSPQTGTPLMLAAPSLAIDLPLKVLIAEDTAGKVSVTYNSPEYLQQRHEFPPDLVKNLAGAGALIAQAIE